MTKRLPATPYVTLSEALSWLAFQDVRDAIALNSELAGNAFGYGFGSSLVKAKLVEAVNLLSDGKIKMRGKYIRAADTDLAQVLVTDVLPIDLQNYRKFDITIDGLRRGRGLAWLPDPEYMSEYQQMPCLSYIAEITVQRSGLMNNFSAILTKISAIKNRKLPKLSKYDFQKWVASLTPKERSSSEAFLREKCNADHPLHHIPRVMTRSLCEGRKRGPKIIEP